LGAGHETRSRSPALHVDELGSGPRVLLVHGGVMHGLPTWIMQRPLARRWRLVMPDLPGFGRSSAERSDSAGDVDALLPLVDGRCHVVGFSYGGVLALLLAAVGAPQVASVAVIEPPAFQLAPDDGAVAHLRERIGAAFRDHAADSDGFLDAFSAALGLPPPARPRHPVLERNVRTMIDAPDPPWALPLPLDALRAAGVPALVVSSGDRQPLETVCDRLAAALGGERLVLPGAGHQVQHLGRRFNDELDAFLARAEHRKS
jgi:pimeloyl-ACP methyl ester carboxylesterase